MPRRRKCAISVADLERLVGRGRAVKIIRSGSPSKCAVLARDLERHLKKRKKKR